MAPSTPNAGSSLVSSTIGAGVWLAVGVASLEVDVAETVYVTLKTVVKVELMTVCWFRVLVAVDATPVEVVRERESVGEGVGEAGDSVDCARTAVAVARTARQRPGDQSMMEVETKK